LRHVLGWQRSIKEWALKQGGNRHPDATLGLLEAYLAGRTSSRSLAPGRPPKPFPIAVVPPDAIEPAVRSFGVSGRPPLAEGCQIR